MPEPKDSFDKDEQGNIMLNPIAGWSGFIAEEMVCCLRLAYIDTAIVPPTGESSHLQIVMKPIQARELAQVLQRMADRVENNDSGASN